MSKEDSLQALYAKEEAYVRRIRQVYLDAETAMLNSIARRLERGIDAPGWAEKKLAEVRALEKEIDVIIADLHAKSEEIRAQMEDTYNASADIANDEIKAAAALLLISGLSIHTGKNVILTSSITNVELQVTATFASSQAATTASYAVDALKTTIPRIKIVAIQTYKAAIADAARVEGDTLKSVINSAVNQVRSGTIARRQAAQLALNRLADIGITGYVDSAGRHWDLAGYVEMATRSGVQEAAIDGHIEKLVSMGYDLGIISSHGNCCPLCGPWESKIISFKGVTEGYPTLADARAAGFLHKNCRHSVDLYIEGVTRPREGVPYDPEAYKARQKQRYNERQIRKWKRRETVSMDDTERRQAQQKIKQWQAAQREHIKTANADAEARHGEGWISLKRDYGREQINKAR